jgi:hypothetical protein
MYATLCAAGICTRMIESARIRGSASSPSRWSRPSSRKLIGPEMSWPCSWVGMAWTCEMLSVAQDPASRGAITVRPLAAITSTPKKMTSFAHRGSLGRRRAGRVGARCPRIGPLSPVSPPSPAGVGARGSSVSGSPRRGSSVSGSSRRGSSVSSSSRRGSSTTEARPFADGHGLLRLPDRCAGTRFRPVLVPDTYWPSATRPGAWHAAGARVVHRPSRSSTPAARRAPAAGRSAYPRRHRTPGPQGPDRPAPVPIAASLTSPFRARSPSRRACRWPSSRRTKARCRDPTRPRSGRRPCRCRGWG